MDSFFDPEGKVVTKPVREIVYEYMRRAIVTGELPQGHHFKDTELATRFGVSRMPVREALLRLETEGLIQQTPMKGYAVVNLSSQDVAHIFSLRKNLEGLATVYACRHIQKEELAELRGLVVQGRVLFSEKSEDLLPRYVALTREFNLKFIESCRVPRLIQLIWQHRELLERFHIVDKVLDRCGESLIDHRQRLLEDLEARRPSEARQGWEEHLDISMSAYFDCVGWPEGLDYA